MLDGTLSGYEDGTKLVICPTLQNMATDTDHDTTIYLRKGKFTLVGNVKEATKYTLRILPNSTSDNPKDFETVSFWVEAKPMTLRGEKGNLFFSDVSGSETQDQYEEFVHLGKAMQQKNRQIKDSVLIYNLSEQAKIPLRKIYNENTLAIEKEQMDFLYDHPHYLSCVAELVFYINFLPDRLSKRSVIEFYQGLSYDFKNSVYGYQIKDHIGKTELVINKPIIGDLPLPFTLPDSSGNNVELASLKGNIILLDFWASGCGPCRLEHKTYLEVYQKYQVKGFEILSVSQDQSKALWLKAMKKDYMIWKSVWDVKRDVTKMYQVSAIPDNYLINKDGTIIEQNLRGERLLEKLKELLNEK